MVVEFLARRFDNAELVRVEVEHGRIARIGAVADPPGGSERGWPWVAPGFWDLQVNGYGGQEFSALDLSIEKVARIVRDHYAYGVTRICPTLTTQSDEVLAHGLATIAAACESLADVDRLVAGIHLEGPYLSPEDGPRGAHPARHCRRPDWDHFARLQEAARGRIRLVTLSPEFDEAPEFVRRATSSGVVVALGHMSADGRQIRAAVDAGARLSTHLGNGAHGTLRRHPNYIWHQLANDRLMASLIVDGHHLPPEVVQTMVRGKTPARVILVSDESGLAGLPPGRYSSSGCELEILADGRLVIAGQDQLLAGASLPLTVGVANVMRFAGIDLATAIEMVTTNPARLLSTTAGSLRPGDPADLVLFDLPAEASAPLDVRATLADGRVVFGTIPAAGG